MEDKNLKVYFQVEKLTGVYVVSPYKFTFLNKVNLQVVNVNTCMIRFTAMSVLKQFK